MEIKKVYAVYFSATDTTKKVITWIGEVLAEQLGIPFEKKSFTLPKEREGEWNFSKKDLIILGTPIYAGRVPNVLLPFLKIIRGNHALAIPIVLFGNRNYDDGLMELRNILEEDGFHTIAAGAFIGEHSFSDKLATGRPDGADQREIKDFALEVAKQLQNKEVQTVKPIAVKGENPVRPYYMPRDRAGNFIDIRKVKSFVNDACDHCGLCVKVCPMGSISSEDIREYVGICIKCGACIKKCPHHARYYKDSGYLYHKTELEEGYSRRAQNEWFLAGKALKIMIRKGEEADLEGTNSLLESCFSYLERTENYPRWVKGVHPVKEDMERAIVEGNLYFAVVHGTLEDKEEEEIAGMVILDHHAAKAYEGVQWGIDAPSEKVLIAHTLAVKPLYRSFGIARKLMKFVGEAAKTQGCFAVRFNTYQDNQPAIALYESCGYSYRGLIDLGRSQYDAPWYRVYEKIITD